MISTRKGANFNSNFNNAYDLKVLIQLTAGTSLHLITNAVAFAWVPLRSNPNVQLG
jgi:hypothetical protein